MTSSTNIVSKCLSVPCGNVPLEYSNTKKKKCWTLKENYHEGKSTHITAQNLYQNVESRSRKWPSIETLARKITLSSCQNFLGDVPPTSKKWVSIGTPMELFLAEKNDLFNCFIFFQQKAWKTTKCWKHFGERLAQKFSKCWKAHGEKFAKKKWPLEDSFLRSGKSKFWLSIRDPGKEKMNYRENEGIFRLEKGPRMGISC